MGEFPGMRALAALFLGVLLLCGCSEPTRDTRSALLGHWVKGKKDWLLFIPEGMVCRSEDRARVARYQMVDANTVLVEEFSGDSTVRNLWTVKATEKGLDVTYPGQEKMSYGRSGDKPGATTELVGLWSANMGVGKTNYYAFDAGGRFMGVRWIRSSSRRDRDREQRRVVEAGRWTVEGNKLRLDGLRRRHFNRTYEFSVAGDELVLTSGRGADRRVRAYRKVVAE